MAVLSVSHPFCALLRSSMNLIVPHLRACMSLTISHNINLHHVFFVMADIWMLSITLWKDRDKEPSVGSSSSYSHWAGRFWSVTNWIWQESLLCLPSYFV